MGKPGDLCTDRDRQTRLMGRISLGCLGRARRSLKAGGVFFTVTLMSSGRRSFQISRGNLDHPRHDGRSARGEW